MKLFRFYRFARSWGWSPLSAWRYAIRKTRLSGGGL